MSMQSSDVYGRTEPSSSVFWNGFNGVSSVSQAPPWIPGVGPWLSTEFVPGYPSITSSLSVNPCRFCQSQNIRSTCAWWK